MTENERFHAGLKEQVAEYERGERARREAVAASYRQPWWSRSLALSLTAIFGLLLIALIVFVILV